VVTPLHLPTAGGPESGPIRVLRSQANGIGSGPQLRMPAFEVMT
jgi:hypothetical protein